MEIISSDLPVLYAVLYSKSKDEFMIEFINQYISKCLNTAILKYEYSDFKIMGIFLSLEECQLHIFSVKHFFVEVLWKGSPFGMDNILPPSSKEIRE